MRIDEVKRLLVEAKVYQIIVPKDFRLLERASLARRICHLFESEVDTAQGDRERDGADPGAGDALADRGEE